MPSDGMEEHPPDQADDDRVHQQRAEQDAVVDRLEALDAVQHQRDDEADQELDQHHGGDEERGQPQAVAERRVLDRRDVVVERR